MGEEGLVRIQAGEVELEGSLLIPAKAQGVVLFAHGSGSSRHSPRNQFVASKLREGHLATLLIDLLTAEEERAEQLTRHLRFDIPLLTHRLVCIVDWLARHPPTKTLAIGLFGSSTGAAAALGVATQRSIKALVSRGGRVDLAPSALSRVGCPTLFLVGGHDEGVIECNEAAFAQLVCKKRLLILPGAGHLFEEPGKLEEVARLAREWFVLSLHPMPGALE